MNPHETPEIPEDAEPREPHFEIDRSDVGVRIVYSLLFALVISVLESLVAALVVYQLVFSLITRRLPGPRVQDLGNRIVAYFRQILRYLTHTDSVLPFPFSDFPTPLEPVRAAYANDDPVGDATAHADPTHS